MLFIQTRIEYVIIFFFFNADDSDQKKMDLGVLLKYIYAYGFSKKKKFFL